MKRTVVLLAAALAWSVSIVCHSSQLTVSPSSDGSLYTCTGCTVVSDGAYVLVSGYIQGAVKFPTAAIPEAITQAILTLNPYGLPLFGEVIDVYGYGTALGQLDETDANAGTFLGALVVPADIGYGDDIALDVTAFVLATEALSLHSMCARLERTSSVPSSSTTGIRRSSSSRRKRRSLRRCFWSSADCLPPER
jgi:hypothetical protein